MELVHLCTALMFGIATYSVQAQTCELPTCFVNGTEEIQCISCPTGWGVAVENKEFMKCRSSPTPRNTKCEPCIGGVNFSDTNNPTSKCVDCLSCHRTKEVQTKECTIASDAVCACIEGSYYLHSGLDSCVSCTVCGEDEMEVTPCTPTQDRECGVRSTPVPTPANPTTEAPISNATSLTGISPGPGISSKSPTKGTGFSAGWIALIVLAIIVPSFLALLVCLYSQRKCRGDSSQNNNGSNPCCLINITDCCIGKQEISYDASNTDGSRSGHSQNNGQIQMNGHAARYHQVPPAQEPNGSVRQNHVTSATDEAELQRSDIRQALDLSKIQLDQLIIKFDEPNRLGRNALWLAAEYLGLPPDSLNNGMRAVDVLHLWVQRGRTKQDLKAAFEGMDRDDLAEFCVDDSLES